MLFRTLFRLLPSLLFAVCFCQSGLGAVQWEMSWEATVESTGIAAPDHPGNGDRPAFDVCRLSGSMDMQRVTSSGQCRSMLIENRLFEPQVHVQSLCVIEPVGKAIQVPWPNFKVPI
ncbi:MAG: hypothetical protein NTW52_00110 [Planctomycetota bacterium]|nr:hypothetical protein [Planctomycetota bacterium]